MKLYRKGGRGPIHRGSRQVKRSKLDEISDRQNAPIEWLLRRIAQKKELKEGESQGDADNVNFDLDGGGGDSCKEVDGKIVCFTDSSAEELSEMATEDEGGDKKPLSLTLADLIKGGRGLRQQSLKNRKKRVGKRRELDLNPDRAREFAVRNPIARARYKSLQRRLARSEGREKAGEQGGYKIIKASF